VTVRRPKELIQGFQGSSMSFVKSQREQIFENRIFCEWPNTSEAARYLSISENALRIMVFRGQIKASRIGSRLRFRLKIAATSYENRRPKWQSPIISKMVNGALDEPKITQSPESASTVETGISSRNKISFVIS
jgi:excisionase family DNA binding protein